MFGKYQQSRLRIEVNASESSIRESLLKTDSLKQWLWSQRFSDDLPSYLIKDIDFTTWLGPIAIQHHVDCANDSQLRFILSQGIDGFHEWRWGEGWVQSCVEGISMLPLNAGQTFALFNLKQYVERQHRDDE